jgi:hypothetical protein
MKINHSEGIVSVAGKRGVDKPGRRSVENAGNMTGRTT